MQLGIGRQGGPHGGSPKQPLQIPVAGWLLCRLIPIVQLWWPYEAIRDLYPPGGRPDVALQWWLVYLIAPYVAFVSVIITTLIAPTVVTVIVVLLAGGLLVVPVVLGWKLIDNVDAMQRAHVPLQ